MINKTISIPTEFKVIKDLSKSTLIINYGSKTYEVSIPSEITFLVLENNRIQVVELITISEKNVESIKNLETKISQVFIGLIKPYKLNIDISKADLVASRYKNYIRFEDLNKAFELYYTPSNKNCIQVKPVSRYIIEITAVTEDDAKNIGNRITSLININKKNINSFRLAR